MFGKRIFSFLSAAAVTAALLLTVSACDRNVDASGTAVTGDTSDWTELLREIAEDPSLRTDEIKFSSDSDPAAGYEHIAVITDDTNIWTLPMAVEQNAAQPVYNAGPDDLPDITEGPEEEQPEEPEPDKAGQDSPAFVELTPVAETGEQPAVEEPETVETNQMAETEEPVQTAGKTEEPEQEPESAEADGSQQPLSAVYETIQETTETIIKEPAFYTTGGYPLYKYEWRDGSYLGRLTIPSVGIDVAVYNSDSQSVTDAEDSANMCYRFGKNYKGIYPIQTIIVADHNWQDFSVLKNCTVGTALYVEDTSGNFYKYICDRVDTDGYNSGSGIYDRNGTDVTRDGGMWVYTCNAGSLTSISMFHFTAQ